MAAAEDRVAEDRVTVSCSFCLKSQDAVAKLVAGPGVYICDECVDLCRQIIDRPPSLPPGLTFLGREPGPRRSPGQPPPDGGCRCAGRTQSLRLREEGESARRHVGGDRNVLGNDTTVGVGAILRRGVAACRFRLR